MFTGIVTDIGTVRSVTRQGDLRVVVDTGQEIDTVALGASIACSGACMTVVDKGPRWFAFDISAESVSRTADGLWQEGAKLNLERALRVGDELGGHIVTGHVDGVGAVTDVRSEGASTRIGFSAPAAIAPYLASKGSITIDGVSLTVNEIDDQADGTTHFSVNIIPHTAAETTLGTLTPGRAVNLEIDVLARYLGRMEAYGRPR